MFLDRSPEAVPGLWAREVTAFARRTLPFLVVVAVAVALGAAATLDRRVWMGSAMALIGVIALAIRQERFWWDLLVVALAGALLFDYGFANIGVDIGVPVPLAEVLLIVLLFGAFFLLPIQWRITTPFFLAMCFLVIASMRLALDLPVWGTAAARDFSLPIEILYLFIGYWAMSVFGLERWLHSLRLVFLISLFYFAFYPWREQLEEVGPVVGLQQPVPLLGNYWGAGTAAAAGFFFFALVRPFGRWSYLIAAAFLPVVLLVQARGLYIAIPAAIGVVALLARMTAATRLRKALFSSIVVGTLAVAGLFAIGPEAGRLGPVTPQFAGAQLDTLTGSEGPSAGTYQVRIEWARGVIDQVQEKRLAWVVGLGLGPDLAGGFETDTNIAVRKPHNDYLEVFARLGVVGLAVLVGVLGSALVALVRAARRATGSASSFLWWTVSLATVYLVIAATQPLLSYPHGTIPLFSLVGAGLAIAYRVPSTPRQPDDALRSRAV